MGRGEAQVFLQLRLALAFPFPLHKCQASGRAGRQADGSSSISRRLAPTCRRSLVSCLPLSLSLPFPLFWLTLFAASWRRAQAHFEVYEATAATAAARGIWIGGDKANFLNRLSWKFCSFSASSQLSWGGAELRRAELCGLSHIERQRRHLRKKNQRNDVKSSAVAVAVAVAIAWPKSKSKLSPSIIKTSQKYQYVYVCVCVFNCYLVHLVSQGLLSLSWRIFCPIQIRNMFQTFNKSQVKPFVANNKWGKQQKQQHKQLQ